MNVDIIVVIVVIIIIIIIIIIVIIIVIIIIIIIVIVIVTTTSTTIIIIIIHAPISVDISHPTHALKQLVINPSALQIQHLARNFIVRVACKYGVIIEKFNVKIRKKEWVKLRFMRSEKEKEKHH